MPASVLASRALFPENLFSTTSSFLSPIFKRKSSLFQGNMSCGSFKRMNDFTKHNTYITSEEYGKNGSVTGSVTIQNPYGDLN